MPKKLTQEEAEERLKTFAPEFIYPPFVYKRSDAPIKAICPIHDEFTTSIDKITAGFRCPKCGMDRLILRNKSVRTPSELLAIIKDKFKDKPLDFSETVITSPRDEMTFRCKIHGYKTSKPYLMARRSGNANGCDECGRIAAANSRRETFEEFVEKSRKAHPDIEYDYSMVQLADCDTAVEIICPKGHHFWQYPYNHYNGAGCPYCKESKGEKAIAKWLDSHNVSYIRQYRIKPNQVLFGRNTFIVDFFLKDKDIIIEYHGRQHYNRIGTFHRTDNDYQEQVDRDKRLREHCKQHKIRLIEIPYTKIKEIDKILDKELGRLFQSP